MSRLYADFTRPRHQPLGFTGWFLVGLTAAVVVAAFVCLMGLFLLVSPARAHEAMSGWIYPIECCAGYDCAEIPQSRVKIVQGGYSVDGHFVPQSEVRYSPDGRYHACFPKPDKLRCLFVPPMGF